MQDKKQQEFDIILKEAFEINSQIEQLYAQSVEVSQKISSLGNDIIKISERFDGGKYGKYGNYASSAGKIVGEAIKIGSELWAKFKQNQINKQMLPKKQEIARQKLQVVKKQQQKILQNYNKIGGYLKQESDVSIDFQQVEKYDALAKGYNQLIEAYFTHKRLLYVLDFFSQEFNAWLAGSHQSNAKLMSSSEIYKESVNELIGYNNFPKTNIARKLTLGSAFLLSDDEKSNYSLLNHETVTYFNQLANKRATSLFLPFSKENKDFNFLYNNYLKENDYIRKSVIQKFLFPIISVIFTAGIALSFYFAFDNNFYLGGLGLVVGVIFSLISKKVFDKQLLDIVDTARMKIDGYSEAANKKILKKFNRQRITKFFLAGIIDFIGMLSYALDLAGGAGEIADAVWAPISGFLIGMLFRQRAGVAMFAGLFGFAEEAVPFTDFIPTALITWFGIYITGKDKTLEKMGYVKK